MKKLNESKKIITASSISTVEADHKLVIEFKKEMQCHEIETFKLYTAFREGDCIAVDVVDCGNNLVLAKEINSTVYTDKKVYTDDIDFSKCNLSITTSVLDEIMNSIGDVSDWSTIARLKLLYEEIKYDDEKVKILEKTLRILSGGSNSDADIISFVNNLM